MPPTFSRRVASAGPSLCYSSLVTGQLIFLFANKSSQTEIMKSFALIAALASLAVATPLSFVAEGQQLPLTPDVQGQDYPGFDLDLSEQRLVQLEEGQDPVWISELDKVVILTSHSIPTLLSQLSRSISRLRGSISSMCEHKSRILITITLILPSGHSTHTQSLGSSAHLRASLRRALLLLFFLSELGSAMR